ncbi:hypothetical protein [Tenacibaculum amylolyticum]|uniref:hypothetical protein n=1 Tax=Tenacibaculum amylolyticum TaxID=104269 RepID=UPI0038966B83
MKGILEIDTVTIKINWDKHSYLYDAIQKSPALTGSTNNIGGEVFFYQYDLDLAFNGTEKEVFDVGDVVYWRSPKEAGKFGILFMYGATSYGDGTLPRTSSPGVKIGTITNVHAISEIPTGVSISII